MSLTTSEMTPADISAVTRGNSNSGWGDGNGAWWIIILFLFVICGWGGNSWGNSGSQGAADNYVLASDFATLQRQIDSATSSLERKGDAINSGLCDGFYAQNSTMLTGFGNVNQNLSNGFASAELARASQQAALVSQLNANNVTALQSANALQAQLAQCCCDQKAATADVSYNLAAQSNALQSTMSNGFCQTNYNAQTNTRDIIESQNANTRAILDKLTTQEIAAKDAQIAAQNQQIFGLQLRASQADQTNQLQSYVNGQFVYYNPRPVPSFPVSAPYQYAGCANGCGAIA